MENVHVGKSGDDYCLSWKVKDDRYHVWLGADMIPKRGYLGRDIYKTPPKDERGKQPDVRHLSTAIDKNKQMVERAIHEATKQGLFEKCEQELAAAEEKHLAQAAEEYKVQLAKDAGPELLAALQGLLGYINTFTIPLVGTNGVIFAAEAAIRKATGVPESPGGGTAQN